jgi:hypothetical protein
MKIAHTPIPEHLRTKVLAFAKHEAGHYVVGRKLGFDAGDAYLTMLDGHGGHSGCVKMVLAQPVRDFAAVHDYLKRRLAVLYAGAVSQSIVNGKPDQKVFNQCLQEGAAGDKNKADELLHLLRNMLFPNSPEGDWAKQLLDLETEAVQAAENIITKDQQAVDELANTLNERVTAMKLTGTVSRAETEALPAIRSSFP